MASVPACPPARGVSSSSAAAPGDASASPPDGVHRRNRLSRSRDFDAVYRHGRSASTRYLVLYWFPRDDTDAEPRLGLAVPKATGGAVVRNRIKRQLREAWRARLGRIPRGRDYVLIARPGLPDSVEARGPDWLGERVDEVLAKAVG
jgi:ribonuclease P protein component